MNNEQRQCFETYISKETSLYIKCNFKTKGGPCGDYACALIEKGTSCTIQDVNNVFVDTLHSNVKREEITDWNSFKATKPGDLLGIFSENGVLLHYFVRVNINANDNTLSINGFTVNGISFETKLYKDVIAASIKESHFGTNGFMYDEVHYPLYRISYTLLEEEIGRCII